MVINRDTRKSPYGYDYVGLDNFLKEYDERFPNKIKSWCWVTKSITSYETIRESILTPLSLFPKQPVLITGVQDTVMKSVRQNLYIPNEYQQGISYGTLDDGTTKDGVSSIFEESKSLEEQIYDPKFIISYNQFRKQPVLLIKNVKAVIPTGYLDRTGLSTSVPALLRINVQLADDVFARFNITHVANKVPGFAFSKYYNQLRTNSDVLVSLESYRNMMDGVKESISRENNDALSKNFYDSYNSTFVEKSKYKLPYNKLIVRLTSGASVLEKDQIKNGMQTFISETDFIFDTIDNEKQAE